MASPDVKWTYMFKLQCHMTDGWIYTVCPDLSFLHRLLRLFLLVLITNDICFSWFPFVFFFVQSQLCFCPLPFYFHLSSNSVLPFVKLTLVPRLLVSSRFILVTVILCLVLHFISLTSLCLEFLALHRPCVSPLLTLNIVSGCLVPHDFEPWFCVSLF